MNEAMRERMFALMNDLTIDMVMRDHLKRQGLTVNVTDSQSYKSLLQAVKGKFGPDFVSL